MSRTNATLGTAERRKLEKLYERISPFELKNKLINLAAPNEKKSTRAMLDAGRGNPNWTAAAPREAFFTLGQFAVRECRRVWNEGDLAGKPQMAGIADRFAAFALENGQVPGIELLQKIIRYGVSEEGFAADQWIYELADGIIGDNYPMPDRMLVHTEQVVHSFLSRQLYGWEAFAGRLDLFAVEGATAAMCYIFESLLENYLLSHGDRIALMVPIFPPYLEIPRLRRYEFDIVEIRALGTDALGNHTWQYPAEELEKLKDPAIKALFLVNPSNPPSVAVNPESVQKIKEAVLDCNPNLIIISDDVYGTFVDNYQALMRVLPNNTIGVYSFSKYFGITGWRLGVIAINRDNIFDRLLGRLTAEQKEMLRTRYGSLTVQPEELRFIDRMVADSRQVALNHTAGLSTPQQVQMALCCAFDLLNKDHSYRRLTKEICHRRMQQLYRGLGLPLPGLSFDADYYTEFDLEEWAGHHYGSEFTDYLKTHYEPVDILFRLAERSSIVLLNGGGFHGPDWSVRVSLANLEDSAYAIIGQELHNVLEGYVDEWRLKRPV